MCDAGFLNTEVYVFFVYVSDYKQLYTWDFFLDSSLFIFSDSLFSI